MDHLLQEVGRASCSILGIYETRRKVGVSANWRVGNMVLLGAEQGQKNLNGIGFVFSR